MNLLEEIQKAPVEWKELGEVLDYEQPTKYIVKSKEYNDSFKTPVLTAGQSFILGYTNEEDGIYSASKVEPVIIFDDFTTGNHWVDFNFKVKSSAMKMLRVNEEYQKEVVFKYVYYFIQTIKFDSTEHGRKWISQYSKIEIPIPDKKIQEKIVQTLDKFTDYVTELTSELTSELTLRQKQYSYFRDYLLNFEDDSYKVEWKTLGEVCNVVTSPKKIKRSEYGIDGEIAIIDQGEQFIAGYINSDLYLPQDDYVIFGDHSEHIKYVDFPFIQGADGLKILKSKQGILPKYLYYCFHNFYEKRGNYKRHWSNAKATQIPLPPLSIQEKIVHVLDNFDTVCNDLNIGLPKEIELRQKQYEYFRDQLLTYTAEGVYTDSTVQYRQDLIRLLWYVFGPIKVSLGDVLSLSRGASPRPISKFITDSFDGVNWIKIGDTDINGKYIRSSKEKITQEGAKKSKVVRVGDFLLSNSMSFGRPYILAIDGCVHDGWLILSGYEDLFDKDYLYYLLSSSSVQNQFKQKASSGTVKNLNSEVVKTVRVTLPPIESQKEISDILNKFDTLTSDLSQGLPKEIALRQKQYEYFRDCLFKFN